MKRLVKAQPGKIIKAAAKTAANVIKPMTLVEQNAKRALTKSIAYRTGVKKLTKKEQYQKAIDDMYRKKGGSVKSKKK